MKANFLLMTIVAVATFVRGAAVPEFPFVYVEGHASKKVTPDMALLSFQVETSNAMAAEAVAAIDEQSKELLLFFSEQRVQPKDIRADEIVKEPLLSTEKGERTKIVGFKTCRYFSITLRELSRYGDIAQKVFSATNIVSVSTQFTLSNQKEIEMDLLAQACRDAKERATQLASGFGCKLGPIHAITQRDFFNIAGAFGVGIEGSGRGISTGSGMLEGIAEEHRILYVPSTIDCENSVLAIFRIKP